MSLRILVAGIGNIFLGDDGFGSEVLRHVGDRLAESESVRVTDYGIGGLHLAYDLLDGWDALVLVDAVPDRGCPGSVHVFEADHAELNGAPHWTRTGWTLQRCSQACGHSVGFRPARWWSAAKSPMSTMASASVLLCKQRFRRLRQRSLRRWKCCKRRRYGRFDECVWGFPAR